MKLNFKFILLVTLFNSAIIILSIPLISENPILFISVELIVLLMIYLSVKIYKSLIHPVNLISSGIETIKDKDFSSKLLPVNQKEMDQLIDVYNKMIDQLRQERTYQQEQNFFLDKLINASPSGIILLDSSNDVKSKNPAAEKYLNFRAENFKEDKLFSELKNLPDGSSKTIVLSGAKTIRLQKSHFIDKGAKCYFVTIEELTNEIRNSEKESYGKVIRMMSHEVNNSIGAINSILHSFKNYSSELKEENQNDYLNALNVAIERNEKLNKFTRNFADVVRLPEPIKKPVNINLLLSDIKNLMTSYCSEKNIDLEISLEVENKIVELDKEQIEQVLVNVLKNSVEAIDSKGKIEIKLDDNKITITDNGKGLQNSDKEKLFKPFFSNKKTGQGIGLTLTKEILSNHNFEFNLESSNGITSFKIFF